MRESSLEDFLGDSDGEATERTPSEDEPKPEGDAVNVDEVDETGEETHEAEGIEPATATYAWTPDGVDCPECETTVERRWRDGDRLVCAECKRW